MDEAHCISQWGEGFRPSYARIGTLRALAPPGTPFFITSATLPPKILDDVMDRLGFSPQTPVIQLSNNRINIMLTVREMQHNKASMKDLDFIIGIDAKCMGELRRTIVYCDTLVLIQLKKR